jgi:hypothetical protein
MIDEVVKGDSLDIKCDQGETVAGWTIRAEIWDGVGNVIEKGNTLAGGSDSQIETIDELNGIFIVHIFAGETLNFDDIANVEVEVEVFGRKFTVLKDAISFQPKRIDWTTPSEHPA